jgi:surface polysaccharide O-acyltransferase-like enzyme
MSKKLLRIVSALIFWSILNIITPLLFKTVTTGVPSSVLLNEILKIPYKILSCEPWSHLWYLYLITGLYLITPLIKLFLQQAKKEHLKYYLALYFIFGLCIPFYNSLNDFFNNIMSFFPNKIYFPFSELTGFLGYYIAGYYFSKYNIRSKYRIIIGIFALFSIAITISGTYLTSLYRGYLDLSFYAFPTPTIMFFSFYVFLLFQNSASKLKFTIGQQKIIQHISKCTFGIYLSHWTILNLLNEIGLNAKIMNSVISIPLLTLLIIIFSYAVTVIIQRIPLLKTYVI